MLLLLLSLGAARRHHRSSRFERDLRNYVHALERDSTNADTLNVRRTASAMSAPLTGNVKTAYAPGFGPELMQMEPPDEDLPGVELKDARPFPGAGTMYPAVKVNMPKYCCTCRKKTGSSGQASAFPK